MQVVRKLSWAERSSIGEGYPERKAKTMHMNYISINQSNLFTNKVLTVYARRFATG